MKLVNEHRSKKWHEHLDNVNFQNKGHKNLWKPIKNIVKPQHTKDNNIIKFDNIPIDDPKKCAKYFNKQFTKDPSPKNKRKFNNYSTLNRTNRTQDSNIEIPQSELELAIKKVKSPKAIGPDGISVIMLKHLGQTGIQYLTKMFNLSLSELIPISGKWHESYHCSNQVKTLMILIHTGQYHCYHQ